MSDLALFFISFAALCLFVVIALVVIEMILIKRRNKVLKEMVKHLNSVKFEDNNVK